MLQLILEKKYILNRKRQNTFVFFCPWANMHICSAMHSHFSFVFFPDVSKYISVGAYMCLCTRVWNELTNIWIHPIGLGVYMVMRFFFCNNFILLVFFLFYFGSINVYVRVNVYVYSIYYILYIPTATHCTSNAYLYERQTYSNVSFN